MDINENIKNTLKELLELKNYKEKYGKDDHYVVAQPLAWEKARYYLEQANETEKSTGENGNERSQSVVCSDDGDTYIEHFHGNVFKGLESNTIYVMKDDDMLRMLKKFIS